MLVGHEARPVLRHLGHASVAEVQQALVLATAADEGGVSLQVILRTVDLEVEVSLDLEQLPEIFVVLSQQAIKDVVAGNDDLLLCGDGLGPQTVRRQEAQLFEGLFEPRLFGLYHSLQSFPYARVEQQVADIEN